MGEVAGALHGWPLILSDEGTLDLVVHSEDRALAAETVLAALAAPDRVRLLDAPPGTYGFADLARAAVEFTVGGSTVEVTGLVDLLRIALTDPAPYSQRFALALDGTLQLTARGLSPTTVVTPASAPSIAHDLLRTYARREELGIARAQIADPRTTRRNRARALAYDLGLKAIDEEITALEQSNRGPLSAQQRVEAEHPKSSP